MDPYFQDPLITLYCADSTHYPNIVREAAVVLTDPPYGIAHPTNYHARGRGQLAKCRDYPPVAGDDTPFNPAWLLGLQRPLVLWGANHFASRLPDSGGWLVWDKRRPDTLDQSTCELAWTNFVKGVRRFSYLWNGMMRQGNEKLVHPTQKPTALWAWVLGLKWTPVGVICDPYAGSGSTLLAARRAGRPSIGFEVSEQYCEIIVNRWRAEII